jgi:hypothetical protein
MADFAVFYRAGERAAAGETLYRPSDGHYMFKYPPSSALLFLPLAALPFEAAKAVWFGVSLAALAGMFSLAGRLAQRKPAGYVLVVSGLILAKFLLHELRLGQINILATLIMLASLRSLVDRPGKRGDLWAGVLTGLAIALKPYAALLLAYLVVRRRWTSAGAALATLAVLLAIPAAVYGIAGNLTLLREWAATLSQSTPALLTNSDNVSVMAFFTKWLGDPGRALVPAAGVLGALAVLTLAVILRGRDEPRAPVLEGALVLTVVPLVSPLGWDYTFLMSLLAVVLVVGHVGAFPALARAALVVNFAIIAFVVYDIVGRDAYAAFMRWSVTTVNFVVVALALVWLRFRQVC